MTRKPLLWLSTAILLPACAGGPPAEPNRSIEKIELHRRTEDEKIRKRQNDFAAVLLTLDKAMDKYAEAMMMSGNERKQRLALALEKVLHEMSSKHFDRLVRAAMDASVPANRAIAASALGFSGRREALDPILNALHASDELVVRNAIFGLAALRDPRTPPVLLGRIIEDDQQALKTRIGASYALLRIQTALLEPADVMPIWQRILKSPMGSIDPAILIHALRGLGLSRQARYAPAVEGYASYPKPLVRCAAAVALGRLGAKRSYETLLKLISPAETNTNVRLFGRKALQALAGNIDRAYDVKEWRKVFERGGRDDG